MKYIELSFSMISLVYGHSRVVRYANSYRYDMNETKQLHFYKNHFNVHSCRQTTTQSKSFATAFRLRPGLR